MNKYILMVALAIFYTIANAHNPNTTAVNINSEKGIWLAKFTISQVGANVALSKYFKNENLSEKSPEEYKKLYIKYIKEHFSLMVDGKEVPLASGGIRLGSHQTDVKFLLSDFPETFEEVHLKLTLFNENAEQNTSVKFASDGKNYKKILNHKKGFEVAFLNSDTGFQDIPETNYLPFAILGGIALLAVALLFFFKRKKQVS